LFAKATAALDRLRALPGVRVEVRSPDPAAREVPAAADRLAFTQIARHLFGNPREVVPSPNAEGIEILAVTGQQGEVRALASRIKQLLLDGVSPEEIVVALRAPDDYADIVDEMFTAAGIPFSCDVAQPLTKWPPLKLLLGALQLEIEDWPFSRLMGLLDSNDFRPAWEEWANGQAVRDVADQLRHLGLDAGRDAILSHLARRAGGDAGETSAEGTRAAAALELRRSARSAVGLLERLSRTTAPLRRGADFKTWSEEILRLIGEFGLLPSADGTTGEPDSTAARELRIWEQFRETLMSVAFLAAGLEATPTKLEPREFLAELTDLLRTVTLPRDTQETGRVRILDSNHVRNLDVPYLFLAGLSESSFPTRSADDCIYGELDRRELNASGLTLGHRAGHLQGEMLLFYGVVTRARRQLVLSYPAVSGRGQPLSPSPYLTALRELFVPGALQVTRAERLDPVPELEGMLGLADLRIVATAEALERRPQLFAALAREPRGREAAQGILAAIDMGSARFQGRGFSPYEGVLQHPANLRELADRFSREYEFSATHLETYAQCPFRFWISRVLQVEPLEQPGVETDYRRRGIFLHQVLAQVHAELKSTLGTGSDSESLHADAALEIAACYQRLLKGILDRERPTSDLEEVLLGLEGRLLERWGTAYAAQWAKYQSELQTRLGMPLLPQKFEVPFGRPHPDAPPDDVVNACLVLGAGADETRVGGRIDRIDVAQVGDVTVFNIIDYKTGSKPRFVAGEVQFGRTLQLVLYALAVEKLGLIGPQAIPYQAGYWCIQESGFMAAAKAPDLAAGDLGPHPDWVNLTDALEEIVPRLAAGIRGGQFPVYNADDECTSQCAYKTVCRVNQIRPLEEKLDKSWQP
jgi:ATP-dependent helicase/DNAse subunit B